VKVSLLMGDCCRVEDERRCYRSRHSQHSQAEKRFGIPPKLPCTRRAFDFEVVSKKTQRLIVTMTQSSLIEVANLPRLPSTPHYPFISPGPTIHQKGIAQVIALHQ
jgi:hypothetical protein